MDRQKEERERGVTIACTAKEFFTEKWHYTIIDAPGHRDFIKNMISGAAQADVALLMVPADGNFYTAIQKGDAVAGEIQGQTRQHARILNLLGVYQLIVGVNKMDSNTAGYKQDRFEEIRNDTRNMLIRVGWKKEFVMDYVPFIPISGLMGDNLVKKSKNMKWWSGVDVKARNGTTIKVITLLNALNDFALQPARRIDAPMRCLISGIYKIKDVGDVLAGRVEQGLVNPGEDVIFVPTHTPKTPCAGKIFTVEMHHKRIDVAKPGDNVGMNIKGLDKYNKPRSGDVMLYAKDGTLKGTKSFTAHIMTLDNIPGELKVGYSPIGFVHCGRAACRMSAIDWKMAGSAKAESPLHLKANEIAQAQFEPKTPLVCDIRENCEGLSRIAFLDGNTVVMLGRVIATVAREDPTVSRECV
jgi:elongation factor 1-alpha